MKKNSDKTSDEKEKKGGDENKNEEESEEKNNEKKKDKFDRTFKVVDSILNHGENILKIFFDKDSKNKQSQNELEAKRLELESKKLDMQNSLLMKEIMEMKDNRKNREKDEENNKRFINNGMRDWKNEKDKIIESIFKEINYKDLIQNQFNNNYNNFKEDFLKKIKKLLNDDLKDKALITEEHSSIFRSIKNDINGIDNLNYIVAGISGVGKSSLINAILKDNLAKEGDDIDSETQEIKPFSNPDKVPGITIYDSVGVEFEDEERGFEKIKESIEKTFKDNLDKPGESLHGILYCISNPDGRPRISQLELNLISEFNNLYGNNNNILTILFTQSTNTKEKTEKKKKQIREKLKNENMEIIEVRVKPYPNYNMEALPLDNLINSMKENAKKILVKANLKQITRKKIKEKYLDKTIIKYNEMKIKINNHEFENIFTKECEHIIEDLIGELNLNFGDLENALSDFIEKLNTTIKKNFKLEYKDKGFNKLYEGFINFNNNYEKKLDDISMREYYDKKFKEFFETKVIEDIRKIVLQNVFEIFLKESREIVSEFISENVKDEEIKDLVDSNIDNILNKLNNK